MEEVSLRDVRSIWNLGNFDFVFSPATGSAGGLLCIWDTDFFQIGEKFAVHRFIAITGVIKNSGFHCGLVNVYGPSTDSDKPNFLSKLLEFLKSKDILWCLGGDFNLFLDQEEKLGLSMNVHLIDVFRDFIFEAELMDLSLVGGKFTWCNNRDPPTFVRLDRFLISTEFNLAFPGLLQKVLPKSFSDHNVVLLISEQSNWGPKPFKCFNYWLEMEDFEAMVLKTFKDQRKNSTAYGIESILRGTKKAVKTWSGTFLKNKGRNSADIAKEIDSIEAQLQQGITNPGSYESLRKLRSQLWAAYRKEESEWLQKSRLRWFSEGDRNTRFFHLTATERRRVNQIKFLKRGGEEISDPLVVKKMVKYHFSNSYNTTTALEVEDLNLDFCKLSVEQAFILEDRFREEEVWAVLFSSDSNRAPGPDGFNMGFFQKKLG
ncbi:hypothetical protein HRI_005081200 [Hibiscus trionum]|uniref:Endonuclease/exonuclease/phosphatase domain-containing protein n=1 Tax=Hibiscus trionum TaxID=183268 RepID=A0A9W7JGJ0_HIBTR|nr:hypothetical protein HRI_005081200 [Hibiscus trionum]